MMSFFLSPLLLRLVVGLVLSVAIGIAGYRRGALTGGGALGAVMTGTMVIGLGGWVWAALLIAFFVSSSVLSFYRAHEKEELAEKFAKGHRRDLVQTLANGGIPAVLAMLSQVWPDDMWFFAAVGAMAAVNADTWATELGVLSRRKPRLIISGRTVDVGTSGGVTWLGEAASLGGAIFIGILGGVGSLIAGRDLAWSAAVVGAATLGGMVGSAGDSLLGATLQAIYWCDACQKETETPMHRCGTRTYPIRGSSWLDNDMVNALASAAGALAAAIAGYGLT
ncbi:MAG: DUF92 domain-containing protein [Anaerolineae bacterium]|jgi:uncharacterized protein (TIGR00297 family)